MTSPFDISPGTTGQILQTNATSKPAWVTITGDVLVSDLGVATVVALQGNTVQAGVLGAGEDGYVLTWEGSSWQAQPPTGGGGGGIDFSLVSFMEAVNSTVNSSDTFSFGSGNDTVGSGFYIYDTVNTHTCTGVRFYWAASNPTSVKCSLWIYGLTGASTVALAATVTISVGSTAQEYIATFGSPVTLVPGNAYSVSVYDTAGNVYPFLGVLGSTSSIMGRTLNTSTMLANSFLMYALPNNGGGTQSPWSIFASGDAGPHNIGVNFFPVEPVLT